MNKLLITIIFLTATFCATMLYAQDAKQKPASKDAVKTDTKGKPGLPHWAKMSLDFSIGTRGAGVGARYRIGESNWGVRLGFSYFPLAYSSPLTLSGYTTHIDLFNNFQGVQLLFEYRPARNSRFKIIAGTSYFYIARFHCDLTPTGSGYNYGTIPLNTSDIGKVSAVIDWTGIAPFIGFGFGSPHPKHKVGCSAGFGFYYLTQPTVTISGTGFLSGNDQNQAWLANNVKDYRYLPVFNFHINYRFKKQ